MIKLIALDLDGTVVSHELGISSRVLSTLKHLLKETDIKLVIATGRMYPSAVSFAKQIGITEPLIAYQGALIKGLVPPHEVILHSPIALETAAELLKMLIAEKYHINMYIDDILWTTPDNAFASFYAKTALVQPNFATNLLDQLTSAPTKIMVIDDTRVDSLLEKLAKTFNGKLTFCRSRTNFCEIIEASVSKWNAIKLLADQHNIQPHEIMAIGDQGNDISMISGAGIGVAMGNAPDAVKAVADDVTAPIDKDGVAIAIEKHVIPQLALS
ncbi:MAG: Cof-type HAD-IIB family hydrolase [Cyanobacteria bacterium P01_H01_bin.74]